MAKELLIYSPITSWAMESVVAKMLAIDKFQDFTVRLNSPGGEVSAGFSFLSNLSEIKGQKTAIIDGQAMSMAAYMLPFFDKVVANDTSRIMFHKASYSEWYKPTKEEQEDLDATNKIFQEKMNAKVAGKPGAEAFMAKLFADDVRNDVYLTPTEAKALGIVTEVRTLAPTAYIGAELVAFASDIEQKDSNNNSKKDNMEITQAELDKKIAEAKAEGFADGMKAEQDRREEWEAYREIDAKAVDEGIASGEKVDGKVMARMQATFLKATKLKAHTDDNAEGNDLDNQPVMTAEQEEAKKREDNQKAILEGRFDDVKN